MISAPKLINENTENRFRAKYIVFVGTLLFLFSGVRTFSQDKYSELDKQLAELAKDIPALNERVSISVSNVSIQEFLRGVANNAGLNIDVDPQLQVNVINNFSNVKVRDILVFICKQYNLEVSVIGNIFTIYKEDVEPPPKPEKINIRYDSLNNIITIDYKNEELIQVAKEITRLTGKNVVLSPGLDQIKVSGYIQSMPFDPALDKFAYANNLSVEKTDDNFYIIKNNSREQSVSANQPPQSRSVNNRTHRPGRNQQEEFTLDIKTFGKDSINVVAEDAPILDIINQVSSQTGTNYFMSSSIKGNATLSVTGATYEEFLECVLSGTPFTFRKEGEIYIIGESNLQDFRESKVIQFQNRSVDKIMESIPKDLSEGLEVNEFPELNSLLVSGPPYQVKRFAGFLHEIDKAVPVVLIEVIILYVNKSITLSTGIQAGLGDSPAKTGGQVMPGVDMTLSSSTINELLNSFKGFGWVNLGNVSPNFYLTLQAMESQGILDMQSTPKLSTISGHEATLSIGNTEYYLEEKTQLYGTQNPTQTTSTEYKSVEAQLAVTIKPIVSGDDQITLDIEVNQSDFTERISKTAPPGTVDRKFKSMIRVKNQEMILLGGLEEKRKNDAGTGTPFLSRIPVIKWFFSSRKYEKSNSKLNVLIRPTIVN